MHSVQGDPGSWQCLQPVKQAGGVEGLAAPGHRLILESWAGGSGQYGGEEAWMTLVLVKLQGSLL